MKIMKFNLRLDKGWKLKRLDRRDISIITENDSNIEINMANYENYFGKLKDKIYLMNVMNLRKIVLKNSELIFTFNFKPRGNEREISFTISDLAGNVVTQAEIDFQEVVKNKREWFQIKRSRDDLIISVINRFDMNLELISQIMIEMAESNIYKIRLSDIKSMLE
jgi:hypothetical protein